jgi:hypothetical protein
LQNLTTYLSSKDGQSISTTDINTFTDEQLVKSEGDSITLDTLPNIDQSQIKILKQDYSALSDTDRKQKESTDTIRYIKQMAYLLISNAPTQILTTDDFSAFKDTFFSHLADLSDSSSNENLEYFSDLGDRLEVIINQAMGIKVPETMVNLHVKFLRIAKGILTLRDSSFDANDPMGKMVLLSKATAYINLVGDFFQNDFKNYFDQLKTT